MNQIIYKTLCLAACAVFLSACDGWINNAETPNDSLSWEQINRPGMIASVRSNKMVDGALVAYIKTLSGEAASAMFLATGAMTDEVAASIQPNILLYKSLRNDNITSSGGQADGIWTTLQNLRARSEELLVIEQNVANADYENLEAIRAYGRYIGNLYSGYAYQLLAESFSATSSEPGGVWIQGKLLSQEEMYDKALNYYATAIKEAGNEELKEVSESFSSGLAIRQAEALVVKLYMHLQKYTEAARHINLALDAGESFSVQYTADGSANGLYSVLGNTAFDAQVDTIIPTELRNNAEKQAIQTKVNSYKNLYLSSLTKYSSLILSDYNEMLLVKAELVLRSEMTGDALALVNTVISSYDKSSVETSSPDMNLLTHFRRVYLFLRGERIADYRRNMVPPARQSIWDERKNKWMPFPEVETE